MTIEEAMKARHAVRRYTGRQLSADAVISLSREIESCNRESGLHIQLVKDEPKAFSGFLAKYGSFRNVNNYIALVGHDTPDFDEKCGYYGERIALAAQMIGLNTCWVAMSFSRGKAGCALAEHERLTLVIAVGYGEDQGKAHRSKPAEKLCRVRGEMPVWFSRGMEAAMLAPTAVNQQHFLFTLENGNKVKAEATGGFYSDIDLGIVKYHFEQGAGTASFTWAQ